MSIVRFLEMLLLFSATTVTPKLRAQEVAYLDLSEAAVPREEPPEIRIGGGYATGMAPRQAFRVVLVPSESGPFDPSAMVKVDITITNLVDKAIDLPWAVDWKDVWGEAGRIPDDYIDMLLIVEGREVPAEDGSPSHRNDWRTFKVIPLYGTPMKPKTVQHLGPNRHVRIRAGLSLPVQTGKWQLRGSISFLCGLETALYLKAATSPTVEIRTEDVGQDIEKP